MTDPYGNLLEGLSIIRDGLAAADKRESATLVRDAITEIEELRAELLDLKYRLAQVVPLDEHFAVVEPLRAAVALHRPNPDAGSWRVHPVCDQCISQVHPCETVRAASGEGDRG